ncbi:biotin/lipoyl-containing protein [Pseudoleptotrichia goodfellowii]|uniref:Biotin-requiring enzyme n=1 Tax=Pseudoleptotrichia goodfellowii F0264 TaxID=596323 RepID=D0GN53_9FUSO|nr:biotin/lipoyl-containing protein [Pseudoleptotrichia goodfellowii]EEY34471.1 Biotin-requiring enzyme [Pseudoleptotrichia goodfellowii F0264]
MIKVYKIKIGEKVYEVEVEAVSEKEGKIETESAKEAKEEKPKETVKTSVSEGDTKVEAPMQGLVVSVDVSAGQKVKVGETLVVLEAMKMENPIVAPVDGTVAGIHVSKGDTVETGTLMVSLS